MVVVDLLAGKGVRSLDSSVRYSALEGHALVSFVSFYGVPNQRALPYVVYASTN